MVSSEINCWLDGDWLMSYRGCQYQQTRFVRQVIGHIISWQEDILHCLILTPVSQSVSQLLYAPLFISQKKSHGNKQAQINAIFFWLTFQIVFDVMNEWLSCQYQMKVTIVSSIELGGTLGMLFGKNLTKWNV